MVTVGSSYASIRSGSASMIGRVGLALVSLLFVTMPAAAQFLQVQPQIQQQPQVQQQLQVQPQLQMQPQFQAQSTSRLVTIQGGGLQFLDAVAADQYNLGLNVVIANGQNSQSQEWLVTDTGNGSTIQQRSSGQYLDAHEIVELDYRVVTRNRQTFDNTQLWRLRDYGGGFYTIQQVTSGRFLEPYLDAGHGFAVVTRPERPGDNLQLWRLGG